MNKIVLNFGDYILNEKRKDAELFLSNRINESKDFGKLISPMEFINIRTKDKIDFFFKDKKYKEDLKKLDLNSVIKDIVDWYESDGGEPGLTWKSTQEALLVQESIGSSVVKITGRFRRLLSRISKSNIKENFKVLYNSVATSLKGGAYSKFLTENADNIINKISGENHLALTQRRAFGDIKIYQSVNRGINTIVDYADMKGGEKFASDILAKLSKGEDNSFLVNPAFSMPVTIDNNTFDKLFLPFSTSNRPRIEDAFKNTEKYQVLGIYDEEFFISSINGESKLFFGNVEVDIDKAGNLFYVKNSFKNSEGKSIKSIDDYKKSYINYFMKNIKPNEYNEKFVQRGAPFFNGIEIIQPKELTKKIDEIADKEVGQAVFQSEEQLKYSDKKDYSLVKKLLPNRGVTFSVLGYAFWALWAREYYNQIGLKSDLYPALSPKDFIKETNKRIQTLDSFNNLNKNWLSKISPFDLGNKFETIPKDVLTKISYYIAQCMQTYYGKIIPTYLGALVMEEATK